MLRRSLLSLVALAAAAAPLSAQESLRSTRTNSNTWLNYAADHALSERWSVIFDLHLRRTDVVRDWQQIIVRPGLAYTVAPGLRVGGGYGFVENYPIGEEEYPEHRLYEQAVLSHTVGTVGISHRYRLEQRWQGVIDSVLGTGRLEDWKYVNRFRYQLRGALPLQGSTTEPGELYLTVYDEVMVNFGRNVRYNLFDQNRIAASIGYRMSSTLRFELGYVDQLIAKSSGDLMERNRAVTLQIATSAPLRR